MAQRWITTKYGARVLIEDIPRGVSKAASRIHDKKEKEMKEAREKASSIFTGAKAERTINEAQKYEDTYNDLKHELSTNKYFDYKTTKGKYYTGKTFGQMMILIGKKFNEAERNGQPYTKKYQKEVIDRIRKKYKNKKEW